MDFVELLEKESEDIVREAAEGLLRAHLTHYEKEGSAELVRRLRALYDLTVECIKKRNANGMMRYVEAVARERFSSGYEIHEVQTAFNVLEESMWRRILTRLDPSDFARAIGLVSTVLGLGKDALARAYVSFATKSKVPSLDLRALFSGTEGSG